MAYRELIRDWAWIDRVQAKIVGSAPYTADQLDAAATASGFTFVEERAASLRTMRLYKHYRHNLYMVGELGELGEGFCNGALWHDPITDEEIAEFQRRNPSSNRPPSRVEQLIAALRNGE